VRCQADDKSHSHCRHRPIAKFDGGLLKPYKLTMTHLTVGLLGEDYGYVQNRLRNEMNSINAEPHRAAADRWTLSRQQPVKAVSVHTHHLHFIISQPKISYSFTVPRRVENCSKGAQPVHKTACHGSPYVTVAVMINT